MMKINYLSLDDIAYNLYYLNNVAKGAKSFNKYYFISNKNIFKEFYNKANNIIRKNKLQKIYESQR